MPDEPVIEDEPEHVEFRGERWVVAVAQWDDFETGGHWHLTLTRAG